MIRRSTLGLVATVVYIVINAAGAVYAAYMAEPMHASLHVALLLPGAWVLSRLRATRAAAAAAGSPDGFDAVPDRLTNLEQSIDAVAIEVDRIGEGQRFMTDFLATRDTDRARGENVTEKNESKTK